MNKIQSSLLNKIIKCSMSTFNKPTILQNLKTYKNSAAQSHIHDYVRSDVELQKIKKQKIDYEFITKESSGVLMFREFAFQQKTQQTLVPHLNCQLPPSGAWALDQIKKELGYYSDLTNTQQINNEILSECQKDIQKAIQQYYTNIGKKNYQFNLQQQINKINQMTDEQYRRFANVLHNKSSPIEEVQQQAPKQVQKRYKGGNQYQNKKYNRN